MGGWRVTCATSLALMLRQPGCLEEGGARSTGRGTRGKGSARGQGVEERRSSNRLSRERSGKKVTGRWNREEKAAKEDCSFNKTL